jgi:hypothetical protein
LVDMTVPSGRSIRPDHPFSMIRHRASASCRPMVALRRTAAGRTAPRAYARTGALTPQEWARHLAHHFRTELEA